MDAAIGDASDLTALGLVHRWLAIRYLTDLVTTAPPAHWDAARIAHAVERVAEAQINAAAWSPRSSSVDGDSAS